MEITIKFGLRYGLVGLLLLYLFSHCVSVAVS